MKLVLKFFALFIALISFKSVGQSNDAVLWAGVGTNLSLTKSLGAEYMTELRFDNNMSNMATYLNEFGLRYRIVKGLDAGLQYRFSRKDRGEYYGNENRFALNLSYRYKLKPLNTRFSARARYQYAFDRIGVVNHVQPRQKQTFRFKVAARYQDKRIKRVSPYIGYELFAALKPTNPYGMDAYRVFGGLKFDLPFKLELNARYIFERENREAPRNSHIYMLELVYAPGKALFKKKKSEAKD